MFFFLFFAAQFDVDNRLTGVPRQFYDPHFGLQPHEYTSEVHDGDFRSRFLALKALKRPLCLLLTQREGRNLNLAIDWPLYLRAEVVNGKLQWSTNTADHYYIGGQVWGDDFAVVHLHLECSNFLLGPSHKLLGEDLLEQFQNLVGLKEKIPWDLIVLAGFYNDLRWFCSSNAERGTGPEKHAAVTDTIARFPMMISDRLQVLETAYRKYRKSLEIIIVGTG